ncbi:DNA cytosine methyltransferase [Nostoc sp. CALU 546]|uniref:DNA cytosine methyltransferase n=1 Tax=Nostoc sp. CALU 546 TaxID=1867241 RepID=UPI003B6715F0
MAMSSKIYRRPTVLDLFCGAGGMSLGFQNAGCEILGGIDKNPHAIKTHHKNFPNCKLKLDAIEIESIIDFHKLNIAPGEVDILIGGPPCQVFSLVGIGKMKSLKKDIEKDPRNFLYTNFIEFINYYKPPFFVMENVDNLENKVIFNKIISQLELGLPKHKDTYPIYSINHKVLTASDYGVPQARKRLFIIGIRRDLAFSFDFEMIQKVPVTSVEEAISDLLPLYPSSRYTPLISLYMRYLALNGKATGLAGEKQNDRKKPYFCPPQSEYQKKMRKNLVQEEDMEGVWNHFCRSHNPVDLVCFAMIPPGGKYMNLPESMRRYRWDIFNDKYKRLPLDKPSWTLTAHMRKDCLAYIHPKQNRTISVREAARLQSFPDDFVFEAPMTRMFELVGNSVPPLLAEAIAKPIVKQIIERLYFSPNKQYLLGAEE